MDASVYPRLKRVSPAMQAIVDRYGNLYAYELLARSAGHGNTAAWIAEMERDGTIAEVDLEVVHFARAMLPAIAPGVRLAANVSSSTLDYRLREYLSVLSGLGALRRRLVIEVTETRQSDDVATVRTLREYCRRHDILFALDDCGDGAHQVEFVLTIQPDLVKVSGRLIEAAASRQSPDCVQEYLDAARAVGAETIAETIDSQERLDFVLRAGFDYVQGFLVGAPARRHCPCMQKDARHNYFCAADFDCMVCIGHGVVPCGR